MTAVVLSLIIVAASVVVLAAVAFSGVGPMSSLRRSSGRMREVTEELEDLRRSADVLAKRAEDLRRSRTPDDRP
jgi:hypothetical protein